MNSDLLIILLLLCSAIVRLALNKPRVDAVALIMMVLLPFTGVVSMDEAITGFSNPNIVLIAAMFVVAHNHPSGDPTPSDADIAITRSIAASAKLLAVPILDHIVIGDGKYFSFKEGGEL